MALLRALAATVLAATLFAPALSAHPGDHSALTPVQTLVHVAGDGWIALFQWAVVGVLAWQGVRMVRHLRARSRAGRPHR